MITLPTTPKCDLERPTYVPNTDHIPGLVNVELHMTVCQERGVDRVTMQRFNSGLEFTRDLARWRTDHSRL